MTAEKCCSPVSILVGPLAFQEFYNADGLLTEELIEMQRHLPSKSSIVERLRRTEVEIDKLRNISLVAEGMISFTAVFFVMLTYYIAKEAAHEKLSASSLGVLERYEVRVWKRH